MNRKLNEASKNTSIRYPLLVLLITSILFILLVPKVRANLFPQLAAMRFSELKENIQNYDQIDSRDYWEFREFYSPGYFEFNKAGFEDSKINTLLSNYDLKLNELEEYLPFLYFDSRRLTSIDILTRSNEVENAVLGDLTGKEILSKNKKQLFYKYDSNHYILIFLKNETEMKKANGFFDYREIDKDLIEGYNWLNITIINH